MAKGSRNLQEAGAPPERRWSVDASSVAAFARYRREGEPPAKRREQKGLQEVLKEIYDNQETLGARAGVTAEDIIALQTADLQIGTVREYLDTARKLVEILEYTEADVDETRHKRIHTIASAVDRRSQERGNEDLTLHYKKTREYRSAIAVKGIRTRRRNQEARAEGGSVPAVKNGSSRKPSRKPGLEEKPDAGGPLPANDASE